MDRIFYRRRDRQHKRRFNNVDDFPQVENENTHAGRRLVSYNKRMRVDFRGFGSTANRNDNRANMGGPLSNQYGLSVMEIFKEQKSHAGMKELLESWGTGIALSVSSFLVILRGFFSERNINLSMAITLFLFAAVWWFFKIRKERRDSINSETIGRTLLIEEKEAMDRIKKNSHIPALPKNSGKEEEKETK